MPFLLLAASFTEHQKRCYTGIINMKETRKRFKIRSVQYLCNHFIYRSNNFSQECLFFTTIGWLHILPCHGANIASQHTIQFKCHLQLSTNMTINTYHIHHYLSRPLKLLNHKQSYLKALAQAHTEYV